VSRVRPGAVEELDMAKALLNPHPQDQVAIELNAYNAAFYELGLRWHWERSTYERLLKEEPVAAERLCKYLKHHHPHLLRAYDANFLIGAIEEKKAKYLESSTAPGALTSHFNWADSLGAELGA
jgi:hypothetical protein